MYTCNKCGCPLEDGDRFCPECGTPVRIMPQNDRIRQSEFEEHDSNRNKWILSIAISTVMILLTVVAVIIVVKSGSRSSSNSNVTTEQGQTAASNQNSSNSQGEIVEAATATPIPRFTMAPTAAPTATPIPTATSTPTPVPTATSVPEEDYIFSNSSTEYLTKAQLENLTKEELLYARNEIYARHGRKFNDANLQAYFNTKSWYKPTYEPSVFDAQQESIFNQIEKANINLILEVEHSKGYYY